MFRSICAVLAGYLVMAISTVICVGLLDRYMAEEFQAIDMQKTPPTPAVLVNLGFSTLCAVAGGFTTSFVAGRNHFLHGASFAGMVFVFGMLYGIQSHGGPQPIWYLAVLPFLGTGGVIAGAWIYTKLLVRRP